MHYHYKAKCWHYLKTKGLAPRLHFLMCICNILVMVQTTATMNDDKSYHNALSGTGHKNIKFVIAFNDLSISTLSLILSISRHFFFRNIANIVLKYIDIIHGNKAFTSNNNIVNTQMDMTEGMTDTNWQRKYSRKNILYFLTYARYQYLKLTNTPAWTF